MRWLLAILLVANGIYLALSLVPGEPLREEVVQEEEAGAWPVGLTLLSEVRPEEGSGEKAPEVIPQVVAPTFAESPPEAQVCVLLGPLADAELAGAGLERLADQGVQAALTWREQVERREYWVYLPAASVSGSAQALVNRMQAQGMDSFLILDGELRGSISLGIFSRHASARRLQERRREQGHEADIHEVFRRVRTAWVELEPLSSSRWQGQREAILEALRAVAKGELEVRERRCEDVASTDRLG